MIYFIKNIFQFWAFIYEFVLFVGCTCRHAACFQSTRQDTTAHTHTSIKRHDPHTDKRGTHTQTYCTCSYTPRVAHFLWFSHFSLFSRQPTSHVAGCLVLYALPLPLPVLVLGLCQCTARRPAGSVRTSDDFCMPGCPNRSGPLFSSLSFFLFCCLIFIFVLPAIPFLATVRVAAVLVIVVG